MTDPRWLKVHSEQVFGSILFESWFVYDDSRSGDAVDKEVCEVWDEEDADMIIAALEQHFTVDTPDTIE